MTTVTRIDAVPQDSIILVGAHRPIDYVDCFRVATLSKEDLSVDYITAVQFSSSPGWAHALGALRNWLVVFVGLEPSDEPIAREPPREVRFEPGDRAVLFRISHRTDDELVMAETDRHLDFRVSIRRTRQADGALDIEVTTVVWFNNALGRLYFTVIKPFHRLIVAAGMRIFVARMASSIHPTARAADADTMPRLTGKRITAAWLSVLGGGLALWMGLEHVLGGRALYQLAALSALSQSAMEFVILLFECVGIFLLFVGGLSLYLAPGLALGDRTAKVFFACVSLLLVGRVALELTHPVTVMDVTPPVLVGILAIALLYWVALVLSVGGQSIPRPTNRR